MLITHLAVFINFANIRYMSKKIIFSVFLITALLTGGLAVADDEPSSGRDRVPIKAKRQEEKTKDRTEVRETKDTIKQEVKNARKAAKTEVKEMRETTKINKKELKKETKTGIDEVKELAKERRETGVEKAKMERETKKEELKIKREEFKENLKAKREEAKEALKTRKEELHQKLKTVKDERKKQAVEKIDDSMAKLNEKMTEHFSEVLKKIEKALVRVEERANKAESRNLNTATVRRAITGAEAAIVSAQTAVEAQAGKSYTLTVTLEENLKRDVGLARQALHTDLAVVNQAVKAAREAVRKAAVALAQIPRINETSVPSPSSTAEAASSVTPVP